MRRRAPHHRSPSQKDAVQQSRTTGHETANNHTARTQENQHKKLFTVNRGRRLTGVGESPVSRQKANPKARTRQARAVETGKRKSEKVQAKTMTAQRLAITGSEQAQAGMGTLLAHQLSTRRTRYTHPRTTLGQGLDQLVPQQMPHVSPASVKKFSRYSKCPIFSEATKRASIGDPVPEIPTFGLRKAIVARA